MADLVLAKPARFVPRGSAGDDPAVASRWVSGLLALEIPLCLSETHTRRY
jgi:hypothetical protein